MVLLIFWDKYGKKMCEYLGYRTQPNYRIVCFSFSILLGKFVVKHISIYTEGTLKQEAHGPRFAHLSDIATADMQMLCNIFPILSSQPMKISSFEQFLVLTVDGA